MASASDDITRLLAQAPQDPRSSEEALRLLYTQLHRSASVLSQRRGARAELLPTELIHEAYLRLFDGGLPEVKSRTHFLCLASQAMGWVLADRQRKLRSDKRGGGYLQVDLDPELCADLSGGEDLGAVREALEAMREQSAELAQVVELRFFGGLSMEAIADAMQQPKRSIERKWELARKLLWARLR